MSLFDEQDPLLEEAELPSISESSPLTSFQTISLSSNIGVRSKSLKSISSVPSPHRPSPCSRPSSRRGPAHPHRASDRASSHRIVEQGRRRIELAQGRQPKKELDGAAHCGSAAVERGSSVSFLCSKYSVRISTLKVRKSSALPLNEKRDPAGSQTSSSTLR